ncbi:MAG: TIGR03085 family metal-binding protein, partial [Nocardioidaceae bacterium]
MTALSQRERAALCDLMDDVGPDAPTLCEGWTTYDLAAHLVLREGSPLSAPGIVLPRLEALVDRGMDRLKSQVGYAELVDRVRQGPPRLSLFRPARVDRMVNTIEYFIHHEDVRRGRPEWQARDLEQHDQTVLWSRLGALGRLLTRGSAVGVELARSDITAVRRVKAGEPTLVVRGLPSELVLFAYGRGAVAEVELGGDPEARAAFDHSQL